MVLKREIRDKRADAETRNDSDTVIVSGRAYRTFCYHETDDDGNIACRVQFRDGDEPKPVSRRKALSMGKVPCAFPACVRSLDGDLPTK